MGVMMVVLAGQAGREDLARLAVLCELDRVPVSGLRAAQKVFSEPEKPAFR